MSDKTLARRTRLKVMIDGIDVSADINTYLNSLTYIDSEEGEADDLQLKLDDRGDIWLKKWISPKMKGLSIGAVIVCENWNSDGVDKALDAGKFEIDDIELSGPPAVVLISGTSLPYQSTVRQTKKSKAWENYKLSQIAKEIASTNGMKLMYESAYDPFYKRVEQLDTSDIVFLSKLCKNAGISLKVTSNMLVLFEQSVYEAKDPVLTIEHGKGGYSSYKLGIGEADIKYDACHVSYADPITGKVISYTYRPEEEKSGEQVLQIREKVTSIDEARNLAMKRLRDKNKFEIKADFTVPGNPGLVAGVTLLLKGWGAFDGKYIVKRAEHTVSSRGYTTRIPLRRVLEGY